MPKRPREEPSSIDSDSSSSPESDHPTPGPVEEAAAHRPKYIHTSNNSAQRKTVMKCSLPPHTATLSFSTFEDFEVHYAKAHANRCPACHRNFPTEHFLGLHIEENHDPLVAAKRAKGEKTNYDFSIVNTGIDKKSSMLRSKHRRPSSKIASRPTPHERILDTAAEASPLREEHISRRSSITADADGNVTGDPKDPGEEDVTSPLDDSIESLTSTMSALRFVPPSVRFGRGGKRGSGLSRS